MKSKIEDVFQECVSKTIAGYQCLKGGSHDMADAHLFAFTDGSYVSFEPIGQGYDGEVWGYDIKRETRHSEKFALKHGLNKISLQKEE